MIFDTC